MMFSYIATEATFPTIIASGSYWAIPGSTCNVLQPTSSGNDFSQLIGSRNVDILRVLTKETDIQSIALRPITASPQDVIYWKLIG